MASEDCPVCKMCQANISVTQSHVCLLRFTSTCKVFIEVCLFFIHKKPTQGINRRLHHCHPSSSHDEVSHTAPATRPGQVSVEGGRDICSI